MGCEIRIGTSGWHYKHWLGTYYPEGTAPAKMLPYYLRDFDTVEINNSFYRLPLRSTFETWKKSTPPDFRFAVKASRFITHMKKLKDPEASVDRFFDAVEGLGKKLGVILFQLPPSWKLDLERFEHFVSVLPRKHRYTFEFREPTWFDPRVSEVLARNNMAFCIYELAGFHSPIEVTADFVYVRLHGPTAEKYQGSYTNAVLRQWAGRIEQWSRTLAGVYVYFDNDQAGFAAHNAKSLRNLVIERTMQRDRRGLASSASREEIRR